MNRRADPSTAAAADPHPAQPLHAFLAPRHWSTWLGIGILTTATWLPRLWQYRVGRALGLLVFCFSAKRRRITEINLELCFPEYDRQERRHLCKRCFMELGIGYLEAFSSWSGNSDRLLGQSEWIGTELMQEALLHKRGLLLLGMHLSSIEMTAPLIMPHWPFTPVYRPQKNPLFNEWMIRGRKRWISRNNPRMIPRSHPRGILQALRERRILYYLVDQDYGSRNSVFAPFFGIEAATIRYIGRLARHYRTPILLLSILRKADASGYTAQISRIEGLPTGSDTEDARLINEALERIIRRAPEQYLWQHRRFKTRPAGSKSFYPAQRSNRQGSARENWLSRYLRNARDKRIASSASATSTNTPKP